MTHAERKLLEAIAKVLQILLTEPRHSYYFSSGLIPEALNELKKEDNLK